MTEGKKVETQESILLPPAKRRQRYIDSGWWVSIPLSIVSSHWLQEGDNRLDAGYHAQEVATAMRLINDRGFDVRRLDALVSKIYILGRFRRIYAKNDNHGWPYITPTETLAFRPTSDRWISKEHAPDNAKLHFAKPGWILVTSSGTVGRLTIATKRLEGYFLSHDLIRILPEKSPPVGYIYTFLASWIGQALITKDRYGATIKHLEPHHIADVPVPLISEREQQIIHDEIMNVFNLREEANSLLDKADDLLYSELGLPDFDEEITPYLPSPPRRETLLPEVPHPKAFSIRALDLDDRLDASYQVPVARMAIKLLDEGKYSPVQVGSIADDIDVAPRFKRIYVPKEYGIPFLQGSHLPQTQPYDLQYLSRKKQENLERWIIHQGWILVTCSGTIGRVSVSTSKMDGWAASQHILRIIPDYTKGHPGYIAAFLMSPYGQHQLKSKIYGGVVDELTEDDTKAIWIPDAPIDRQEKIGQLVVYAFEKKDEAIEVENNSIRRLETILGGADKV